MKRCPQCRRDYYDETLVYCLDDGSALLDGPGSMDDVKTAILSDPDAPTVSFDDIVNDRRLNAADANRRYSERSAPNQSSFPALVTRSKLQIALVGLVGLAGLGGISFALYKFLPQKDKPAPPLKIDRLTTNGKTSDAGISPDGKFVVYVVDEDGQQSLWMRQVATNSNVQIVPAAHVNYRGLGFSPDSNYINFVKEESPDVPPVLYQMPALGGVQKKLISNIFGTMSYSPDGKEVAFLRPRFPSLDQSSLLIANPDGTGERILISIKRPDVFPSSANQSPTWSPDGKSIAAIVRNITSNETSVGEIQVADGSLKTIGAPNFKLIARLAWLPDKSGVLFLGTDGIGSTLTQQISLLPYPSGEVRRITNDLNLYFGLSLTADGRTISTVQNSVISNIWVIPPGDPSRTVQIKSGGSNFDGMGGLAWTPDGRVVYSSMAGGAHDIWIMNGNGSGQKQLTNERVNLRPKVTPDGRYIVFESMTTLSGEQSNIWRMDLDGANLTKLTSGNSDGYPSVTPDSRWVVYTSRSSQDWRLWKVSIDGGIAEQLTDQPARNALVSPDGKFIFCEYGSGESLRWRKAVIPFEAGPPVRFLDIPSFANIYRWSSDSRSITYLGSQGGAVNLWTLPMDGTAPKQLTNFKTEDTFDFDWSPDGGLVLARGPVTRDVVLISNFR
jgi:Tol biopolymer transport system component